MVPVPAQVGSEVGNHDEMERSGRDRAVASGAEIGLARRIRLNRGHGHLVHHDGPPQATIAQMTTAAVASSAMTTMAMSRAVLVWGRNGLNPMADTVNGSRSKSEHGGDPVDDDKALTEADGDQIDPPDADLSGQPPELFGLCMVERFDRGSVCET